MKGTRLLLALVSFAAAGSGQALYSHTPAQHEYSFGTHKCDMEAWMDGVCGRLRTQLHVLAWVYLGPNCVNPWDCSVRSFVIQTGNGIRAESKADGTPPPNPPYSFPYMHYLYWEQSECPPYPEDCEVLSGNDPFIVPVC